MTDFTGKCSVQKESAREKHLEEGSDKLNVEFLYEQISHP